MGIDLIGEDVELSVLRAIDDIVHRVCIPYFREKGISFSDARLIIDIYTPYPEGVSDERVLSHLPVKPGDAVVRKHRGGAIVETLGKGVVSIVALTIMIPKR